MENEGIGGGYRPNTCVHKSETSDSKVLLSVWENNVARKFWATFPQSRYNVVPPDFKLGTFPDSSEGLEPSPRVESLANRH